MSIRKPVVFAAVLCLALSGAVEAQARAGGGGSFGSRGAKSFNSTPSTRTAPSVSPLGQPSVGNQGLLRPAAGSRGMFGSFGRGLLGGLLGAGLFGLLFGHGLFGGLGGFLSIIGLLIQIALIVLLVRFAIGFFRSRQTLAGASPTPGSGASFRTAASGPFGGPGGVPGRGPAPDPTTPLALEKADYDRFESTLLAVQSAFSNEDAAALRKLGTPEVAEEFAAELAQNRSRGVINPMSDVRFIRGDLAEAWRESGAEYASVAMRYSLIDALIDRASGRVVQGDANRPQEVTEVWTFTRPAGGRTADWILSAIQQGG